MSTISDLQLINQIKDKADSQAVVELVNRHTGIYMTMIDRYSIYPDFLKRANVADLKEEKTINIYQWALSYDPGKETKFSSYVGSMTKHLCQNIIYRDKANLPFDETISPSNETGLIECVERDSALEEIEHEVADSEDAVFKRIFGLRHGSKMMSWRKIGKAIGLTHEGARKVYMKHIGAVKEHVAA